MTSRFVDGHLLPAAIAGDRALELCNTRAGWGTAVLKEYLVDFTTFAVWAREIGLITPVQTGELLGAAGLAPRQARAGLDRALELRESLYAAVTNRRADAL